MDKTFNRVAKSAQFFFLIACLGCGSNGIQQLLPQDTSGIPNIIQVLPQSIPAGSGPTTLKVTGSNFAAQSAILWNGMALATTVIDANTLSGTIQSNSLTSPATVGLQVRNTQTMQDSTMVPVVVSGAVSNTSPVTISTAVLPQGIVSTPYSVSLAAGGGIAPYTWSITTGNLPTGLSLAAETGIISGTPLISGNYSLGITALDSSIPVRSVTATLVLSIAPAPTSPTPLTVSFGSMPSGTLGVPYSSILQASGGVPPYIWSITSGSLPSGLSLAGATGSIVGTPISSGTAIFAVSVTDSAIVPRTKSIPLQLIIQPAPLIITSSSTLPAGMVNSSYTSSLEASGGTAPYTWSVTSGSLPQGLGLAAASGIISGTPNLNGNYLVGVTVTDSGFPQRSATALLDMTVAGGSNTFYNLQNSQGWKSSGQLAPNYDDCVPYCPGVTWSMTQGIAAPSLSDSAAQFNLGGTTPYSDVLFYNQLIGAFSTQGLPDNNQTLVPSLHNFTYDAYFYLSDAAHTQAMEFDINWFMNSVGITWGTECRIRGGNEWDIWDNVHAKWIATGFPCNPIAHGWNHVTVTAQRGPNNSVIYQSITLNGVTSNINQTYAPFTVPSDWYGITVNYQMDGDENQTAITSYLDKFSFTYQ